MACSAERRLRISRAPARQQVAALREPHDDRLPIAHEDVKLKRARALVGRVELEDTGPSAREARHSRTHRRQGSTVEREFLPDALLPDGRTLHEAIAPQIAESYQTGGVPQKMANCCSCLRRRWSHNE